MSTNSEGDGDMKNHSLRLVAARECDIAALPSDIDEGGEIRAVLVSAKLIMVVLNGVEDIRLAGYISPTKVRMTSSVLAYDPARLLVRTENSLYSVRCLLKEEMPDEYMLKSLVFLLLGQGSPPGDIPHVMH